MMFQILSLLTLYILEIIIEKSYIMVHIKEIIKILINVGNIARYYDPLTSYWNDFDLLHNCT